MRKDYIYTVIINGKRLGGNFETRFQNHALAIMHKINEKAHKNIACVVGITILDYENQGWEFFN
jgi:hypothetical protein